MHNKENLQPWQEGSFVWGGWKPGMPEAWRPVPEHERCKQELCTQKIVGWMHGRMSMSSEIWKLQATIQKLEAELSVYRNQT